MALILSLDTSTKVCSIALHKSGAQIACQVYHLQKSHASLLPLIIQQLMENVDIPLQELDALSVSAGPGSYTGLRIGTSTVKGLCMGLDIPLIAIDSLDSIFEAYAPLMSEAQLLCPMIDARRMEVFCNLRDRRGEYIWNSKPLILDQNTFESFADKQVVLLGDGAEKCHELYQHVPYISIRSGFHPNAFAVSKLVEERFQNQQFEDLAYFEPDYLKEYQTKPPSNKLKV